jgi:DNA-binding beta-propeller fold protein YncE
MNLLHCQKYFHRSSTLAVLVSLSLAGASLLHWRAIAQTTARPSWKLLSNFQTGSKVAEILAATPNGKTLIYTDSSKTPRLGFVDITQPAQPRQIGFLPVTGEPTSVAITPDGRWALAVVRGTTHHLLVIDVKSRRAVRKVLLGGQPDCITISRDGRYAAIAVENERNDSEKPMPQAPAGFLSIVDLVGAPARWKLRNVRLTGLSGRFNNDPEPEFVSINARNQAALTLQENNAVAIIDLKSGHVLRHWTAGTTTHAADTQKDDRVAFTGQLKNARREPDAIAWTPQGHLVTANEGDYDADLSEGEFTGGRNFTIFDVRGRVVYDAGAELEKAVARAGYYPDKRSEKQGVEPEGVAVTRYGNRIYAFIGCERAACVVVYDLRDESRPRLVQVLKTGEKPEGLLALPQRDLFISANEGDGTLSIFRHS